MRQITSQVGSKKYLMTTLILILILFIDNPDNEKIINSLNH